MPAVRNQAQKGRQEVLDEYITFHDIFALALALTSIQEFSSRPVDWHRAFYEICQKHRGSVPELANIFFDHSRTPLLPPTTERVDELQLLLMMSRELEGLDDILRMPNGVRPRIIKGEEKRLAKYMKQIKDMAKIFDKHLQMKSRSH